MATLDGTWQYGYDSLGAHQRRVLCRDGSTKTLEYEYDAVGNRVGPANTASSLSTPPMP